MSNLSSPAPAAAINLTIETFHEIRTGRFCTIGQITVARNGLPVYGNPMSPYPVRVAPAGPVPVGTVDLQFFVSDSTPPPPSTKVTYNVEAVYFSGTNGASVFSSQSSSDGSVIVQDVLSKTGHWNILLIVKRYVSVTDASGLVTTWTSIGVIDPPIDNEPN